MTIRAVRGDLFHVDRRTERHDEIHSHFLQFFESAQNELFQNRRKEINSTVLRRVS